MKGTGSVIFPSYGGKWVQKTNGIILWAVKFLGTSKRLFNVIISFLSVYIHIHKI